MERAAILERYRGGGIAVRVVAARYGISRSTLYYRRKARPNEALLRERVKELAKEHPASGYRMIAAILRLEGWQVNQKRVYRIYCGESLQKPAPRRRGGERVNRNLTFEPTEATLPNDVWAIDIIEESTEEGKTRMLTVEDVATRYAFPIRARRSLPGEEVAQHLIELFRRYGAPRVLRRDNGPEFRSKEVQMVLAQHRVRDEPVPKGKPFYNGHEESFHATLRREFLDLYVFTARRELSEEVEHWRHVYNEERPHSAVGYLPPGRVRREAGGQTDGPSAEEPSGKAPTSRDAKGLTS